MSVPTQYETKQITARVQISLNKHIYLQFDPTI